MASTGITLRLHKFPDAISGDDSVQPYLGQNYRKLKEEFLRKGELFIDPDFQASPKSIGYNKWQYFISSSRKLTWKRPKDIYKHGTPLFINEGMTQHDVIQKELGDCWYLAAAASLTFHPQLLHRVVPPDQSFAEEDYAGIFHFQFWQYGNWVDVVVDDLLPVDPTGQLVFANLNESNDFWMPLLEKAYAKLNGSYEAIAGGWPNEAFVAFTGGIGERIFPLLYKPKLFETIEMALERKSLLGAGTENPNITTKGLKAPHAYSIIGTHKLNIDGKKVRLVKLRDPWGRQEWTGNWSDSSEMWSKLDPELRKTLTVVKDDGEFWMELDDFKQNFSFLDICHLSANALKKEGDHYFWKSTSYHGHWIKGVNRNGYRQDDKNFWKNPLYFLSLWKPDETEWDPKGKKYQLQESSCSLIVSLMLKNWRRSKASGQKELYLGFYIYQVPKEVTKEYLQLLTTTQRIELLSTFRNFSKVIVQPIDITDNFQLPPGNYMIIPFTISYHDGAEFILRIFTEGKHECLELDDEISADEKTLHVGAPPKTGVNRIMDTIFLSYAGQDKKIGIAEFKNFMNQTYTSGQKLQTDGFFMEDCQKIIQHFDESGTGKLTQDAFKQCVAKIDEWVRIFINYDVDDSGTMEAYELCDALEAAGFHLNNETIDALWEKFRNPFHQICFDKFVTCLVLLESLFRKVKSWSIRELSEKQWLELIKSPDSEV